MSSEDGERILQFLVRHTAGRNQIMEELKISNHPLEKKLDELCKEGYITKTKTPPLGRGRPTEPYVLTEKGTRYLKRLDALQLFKEIEQVMDAAVGRGDISFDEYLAALEDASKSLGILLAPHTPPESSEMDLEKIAEEVDKVQPNKIVLIDVGNGQYGAMQVLFKKAFRLREERKGLLTTIFIEPTELMKAIDARNIEKRKRYSETRKDTQNA
jgi:DNA-binding HxlR family transcriptional regulator